LAGPVPWRISVDRWPEAFDVALWFRAVERIDVASGGVVPGTADVEPLPARGADPSDEAELAEGWLAWWHALTAVPELAPPFGRADRIPLLAFGPRDRIPELAFGPPGFPGLAGFPALRRLVIIRWKEARDWHTARKAAGLKAGLHRDMRPTVVVTDLERELGRQARPFSVDLLLLPVADDQVRPIGADRYLIPERLYDAPLWPHQLRELLLPHA
jgi:hypothetical protein